MMMRSEKGVSAVEFALIAPLLFVLTFGIVEFALLLFDKAVITNASREGARAAIVYRVNDDDPPVYAPLSIPDIQEVVTDYANDYLINLGQSGENDIVSTDIEVTYSNDPTNPESWGAGPPVFEEEWYVMVTVPYTYDFLVLPNLTALLGGTFDGTIDLVGRTIMRME
jgi:Flp pilus assembly protein TadG